MIIKEDMRGLFYIVKGAYSKTAPEVVCEDGEKRFIGGYDPTSFNTKEWYRVLDVKTRFCVYAGSSYEGALKCIEHLIRRFRSARKYFQWISEVSSEDFYFVHYLGQAPFTPQQAQERSEEGRQPRQSYAMKCLEAEIYNEYGHFYDEDIEVYEDKAYEGMDTSKSVSKSTKKVGRLLKKHKKEEEEAPKTAGKRVVLKPKLRVATI